MSFQDPGLPEGVVKHPCVRPPPAVYDISPTTRDNWEIDPADLKFVKKLGQGSFGEVWLGECLKQKQSVSDSNTTLPFIMITKSIELTLNFVHFKSEGLSDIFEFEFY